MIMTLIRRLPLLPVSQRVHNEWWIRLHCVATGIVEGEPVSGESGASRDEALRAELRLIEGVADAEFESGAGTPGNVRVRLAADADADMVGSEVRRVLAEHGMRSRLADDDEHMPAPVVSLPVPDAPVPPRPEAPPPLAGTTQNGHRLDLTAPQPTLTGGPADRPAAAGSAELKSVSVEESPDGITVVAIGTDGRRFSQRAPAAEEAIESAVVAVVGALADGKAPRLLAITPTEVDGSEAIMVMVERSDGARGAGAAVVRVGRAFAIGRATWAALRS
jgi:hypothetical protein